MTSPGPPEEESFGTVDDAATSARQLIERIAAEGPVPEARTDVDTASLLQRFPRLRSVTIRKLELDGPQGKPVPARSYSNGRPSTAGLVWVHGGAFISGDLDMPESNWVAMELAAQGIPVLALDYRKALHGVHHPVLSDEILAGWRGVIEQPEILGVPAGGLHLGGASAGANLAAGVALRLLAGAGPVPATLIQVYPLLHPVLPAASPAAARAAEALDPQWRFLPGLVRALNINYVGGEQNLGDPIAFPALGKLAGMPPVYIINAEADDLRASGEAFAARLRDDGVTVRSVFEPGTRHGYLNNPGETAALETISRLTRWMRRN